MSNNLITFSLWGCQPKYLVGALRNIELAKRIYPEFQCRFYVACDVPSGVLFQLEDAGAQVVETGELGSYRGMFWRFEAINEVGVVLVRDADSRISLREEKCVNEWLKSDSLFHTIIDHPFHRFFLMPGLSGFKKSSIDIPGMMRKFDQRDVYGTDYDFFRSIFNQLEDKLLIHDSIFNRGLPMPPRQEYEFCGEVYEIGEDTKETTVIEHTLALKRWIHK